MELKSLLELPLEIKEHIIQYLPFSYHIYLNRLTQATSSRLKCDIKFILTETIDLIRNEVCLTIRDGIFIITYKKYIDETLVKTEPHVIWDLESVFAYFESLKWNTGYDIDGRVSYVSKDCYLILGIKDIKKSLILFLELEYLQKQNFNIWRLCNRYPIQLKCNYCLVYLDSSYRVGNHHSSGYGREMIITHFDSLLFFLTDFLLDKIFKIYSDLQHTHEIDYRKVTREYFESNLALILYQ